MSVRQFEQTPGSSGMLSLRASSLLSSLKSGSHLSVMKKTGDVPNPLATHIPDVVVRCNFDKELPSVKNLEGVLMFADISGFTALCEKFAMSTRSGCGTDRLSKALNDYLGAIVENILSSGGDVLNFAGDALLALWEIENHEFLEHTVLKSMECGLKIQEKCDNWDTDVGVKLRVKIGLAVGEMHVTYFGNDEDTRLFVATGPTVDDVNSAEKFAESGSITLSPTVWVLVKEKDRFLHEYLSDGKHVRVLSHRVDGETQPTSSNQGRRRQQKHSTDLNRDNKSQKQGLQSFVRRLSTVVPGQIDVGAIINTQKEESLPEEEEEEEIEQLTKRLEVFTTPTFDEEKRLRLYVMRTVLQKIDDGLPLEYLSEMRQVTIIFVNMTLAEVSKSNEADILQTAFGIIHTELKRFHGCLNKIFMFDKGCTFLAIFGLPGDKHEDDCAHALQCSFKMHDKLKSTPSILQVSIGVTTGKTFCGVVGHTYRHEYTVIGNKVNMAARLMMHYPGKLSCDPETYHHSKLPRYLFHELPYREMKGVKNPGVIHEYVEVSKTSSKDGIAAPENEYPLLGRDSELQAFLDELHLISEHREKGEHRRVIVFEGDSGIGKTRMLEACIKEATGEGIRVVSCNLTLNDAATPYHAVTTLIELLLEMDNCANHVEREHAVLDHIVEENLREELSLLNDLLSLKFPSGPKITQMSSTDRAEALHRLMVAIVHQFTIEKCVIFAVDDAHFIDKDSWEFITDLSEDSSAVCLLAMRPFPPSKPSCPSAAKVLQSSSTLHLKLSGLPQEQLAPLACQILEVVSIPEELLKILRERSHGVASWCEQLLRDMFFSQKIQIVAQDDLDNTVQMVSNHVAPESRTVTRARRASVSSDVSSVVPNSRRGSVTSDRQVPIPVMPIGENGAPSSENDAERAEEEDHFDEDSIEKKFCVVAPGVKLNEIPVPDSMKGMILAKIDRLKSGDQMVLKCAAVLGISFTRSLLEKIVPNFNSRKIRMGIHSLMQQRLFECAAKHTGAPHHQSGFGPRKSSVSHHGHQRLAAQVECHCPRDTENAAVQVRTNISNCRMLRFKTSLVQEVAYTLFLSDQRRKLHEMAALFLESQAHKCKSCGGGEFIHHYQSVSHALPASGNEPRKSFGGGSENSGGGSRRAQSMAARKRPAERTFRKERRRTIDSFDESLDEIAEVSTRRGTIFDGIKKVFQRKSKVGDEEMMEYQARAQSRRRGSMVSRLSEKLMGEVGADVLDEEVTFREIDLRDCECPQVLASVYPQLVRHWRAASNTNRTIHFLTEAGGAAIATHNNMTGVSYLMEAHQMLKDLDAGKKPLIDDPDDRIEIDLEEKARVDSLIGQALLHMGRLEEAMPHLLDALKSLGNKQPTTRPGFFYRLVVESVTQYLHLKNPGKYVGHASSIDCNLFVEQARCLSHVWHVYHETHKDMKAWLAALQQVNRAEKADDDLHDLLVAYMAMVESCQVHGWHKKVQIYEEMALARCVEVTGFSPDDLVTVGHLYSVVMGVRLSSGRIQKAIDSGFQSLKVAEQLHDNSLKLSVLPTLSAALMLGNRSVPCVEVLEQLDYISDEEEDIEGRGWYFCCCLDLLLELGFALESHNKCVEFVTKAAADSWHVMNPIPRYYMNASLALWYSRKNDWDQAEQFFSSSLTLTPDTFETYMAVNAHVKLVEAELIAYSNACRLLADITKMKKQAWEALDLLRRLCKKFQVFLPRYFHLLAFYHILSRDRAKCQKCLEKSLALSEKMSNTLEHQWAEHSEIVWFDPNHSVVQDEFWQLSTEDDLDWHMASAVDGEISKFSLPLPSRLHDTTIS